MSIIFLGCAKSDEDTSFIYNLEEEFVIRPVELLTRSSSKLTLKISSLQNDLCTNSEILYKFRQIDGVSIIELNDITIPTDCSTTDTPPSVTIALNPSGSEIRLLNITIKDIIENEGQIDEFEDRYEIKMNSTDGIKISHRELMKIQPTMVWGGADYENIVDADVADAFLTELAQMTQVDTLKTGYYGQFEKMSSGNVEIWNDASLHKNRSTFALDVDTALSSFSTIIEDYRTRYPDMRFFAYNAFGESL